MSSTDRIAAISAGPAPRMRIAANGSAVRVMSDPKSEIVLADQTATKLRSRQIVPRVASRNLPQVPRNLLDAPRSRSNIAAEG
jgi:hypothetical protein